MRVVVFALYYPVNTATEDGAAGEAAPAAASAALPAVQERPAAIIVVQQHEPLQIEHDPPALPAPEEPAEDASGPEAPPQPSGEPYELLGLFAPEMIRLQARLPKGDWTRLVLSRAGLYRPTNFRPAPWSGLAYDPAPPDGNGLFPGAKVLTMRGEVPVEQLLPRDRVLGLRGPRVVQIAWIGRCTVPAPAGDDALVRIPANALGHEQPSRDMLVGPNQVLFPDGALPVTARDLLGTGVAEAVTDQDVELFQLVLSSYPGTEQGDVMLVDGVFAASMAAPGT